MALTQLFCVTSEVNEYVSISYQSRSVSGKYNNFLMIESDYSTENLMCP
jgi:hypothetical protein